MVGAGVVTVLVIILIFFAWLQGASNRGEVRYFLARTHGRPAIVAVLFSGDMGLQVGMGPQIAQALSEHGIPVAGLSSFTLFAEPRSRAEVARLIATAIQHALDRTGAKQAVVIGQSFGADIVRVGIADLQPDLRHRVRAVVLIVPGRSAYFRADPTGLAYLRKPDVGPSDAQSITWTPLICISGASERDSLCPTLQMLNVRSLVLPGGHFLQNDHRLVTGTILAALDGLHGPAPSQAADAGNVR